MDRIDSHSRVTAQFTLTWHSSDALHSEQLWAHPVSFWRDVIDAALVRELMGKTVGERAEIAIPANRFSQPFSPAKRVRIRSNQFVGTDASGQPLLPVPGRFYPQGILRGLGGVYQASTSPCRFLGVEGDSWHFDLNHPLAGYDLVLGMEIMEVQSPQKERGGRCEDWLERITSDGPGMQARFEGETSGLFALDNFFRVDEREDPVFYQQPRLVQHLDSTARAAITGQYRRLVPAGSRVLDLMGSWDSHLPAEIELAGLTVLGMNGEELRHNPRATATVVQDLNLQPQLSFEDNRFDAVLCTASIEYLIRPLAVMAEVQRVLRPGGVVALAFSNRWFPPKAIRIWTEMHEFERLGWVAELLRRSGGWRDLTTFSRRGLPRPADDPHQELWLSDPVYMVWAWKV